MPFAALIHFRTASVGAGGLLQEQAGTERVQKMDAEQQPTSDTGCSIGQLSMLWDNCPCTQDGALRVCNESLPF